MEPMTVFDWLLANEVKRQVDSMSDFERQRSADSVKAADMGHIRAWYGPGMADLRAVAESEGEENGVSERWLRKRRGDLVKAGSTVAEINALTMPQFFLALTGRLQAEQPIPGDAEVASSEDGEGSSRNSKWTKVHALLDNELDADGWDEAKRRLKVIEWNEQYGVGLTYSKLGELIRDRRKRPKDDD